MSFKNSFQQILDEATQVMPSPISTSLTRPNDSVGGNGVDLHPQKIDKIKDPFIVYESENFEVTSYPSQGAVEIESYAALRTQTMMSGKEAQIFLASINRLSADKRDQFCWDCLVNPINNVPSNAVKTLPDNIKQFVTESKKQKKETVQEVKFMVEKGLIYDMDGDLVTEEVFETTEDAQNWIDENIILTEDMDDDSEDEMICQFKDGYIWDEDGDKVTDDEFDSYEDAQAWMDDNDMADCDLEDLSESQVFISVSKKL